MALSAERYTVRTDRFGLKLVTMRGWCQEDDIDTVEAHLCRRYVMVPLPQSTGAVLKSLDGSAPYTQYLEPPTWGGEKILVVKVVGHIVGTVAPLQSGGAYDGHYVLAFEIVYQEVNGVS